MLSLLPLAKRTGLLTIEGPINPNLMKQTLVSASSIVSNEIYVLLRPYLMEEHSIDNYKQFVSSLYSCASSVCPNHDVYIVLSPFFNEIRDYDVFIRCRLVDTFDEVTTEVRLVTEKDGTYHLIFESDTVSIDLKTTTFQSVCIGGSFDILHYGHRALLTVSAMLAGRRLLVGITDNSLLREKLLAPLIQTREFRASTVKNFLQKIGLNMMKLEICYLSDPFGPPAHQPDFDCIVASPETVRGCEKINQLRNNQGFPPLRIERVEFVSCKGEGGLLPQGYVDSKISSSTLRINLLGCCLLKERLGNLPPQGETWVIGLTGCVASGKSSIVKHLQGCAGDRIQVIDVDILCRSLCEYETEKLENLRRYFNLGSIKQLDAFLEIDEYEKLAIFSQIRSRIGRLLLETQSNQPVIVLKGSLLFQTGVITLCDELWTVYVSRPEVLSRIEERCGTKLGEEVANHPNESGIDWWAPCQRYSGRGPIGQSSVVFCTHWDEEFSRTQVERAWQYFCQRSSSFRFLRNKM